MILNNIQKKKFSLGVLPPDNHTGFSYDHQGVVMYARAQEKKLSELSEGEKKKFLINKSIK